MKPNVFGVIGPGSFNQAPTVAGFRLLGFGV